MLARNDRPGGPNDRSGAVLAWAHGLLTSPASASLAALLADLARSADARSAVLACPDRTLAWAGEEASPPTRPELVRQLAAGTAAAVAGADGSAWLVAAAGTPGQPEWLLWLRSESERCWTDAEKAALALAADATVRHLLARPEHAAAFRQGRLELAAEVGARVAHDSGNVLTSILGFAELGLNGMSPSNPTCSCLQEVRRSAEEGARFTHRLRLLGRPGRGTGVPSPLPLVLADEARRLARETANGICLRSELAADLPAAALDTDLLRLLLSQLLDNACDALGRRGVVTVRGRTGSLTAEDCLALDGSPSSGPCLEMTVTDDGPGLTADARRRVLVEPLFSTKPKHRGLGLGIAVALARANGAGLRIDRGEGGGTVVRLYLPAAAQAADGRNQSRPVLSGCVQTRGTGL